MMNLILYVFFSWSLGKQGFLFFLVVFLYHTFFSLFFSMSFSVNMLSDLVGYSMCVLTVLIFLMMFLGGVFEYLKKNNWLFFLLLLVLFFVFLVVVFLIGSFMVFYLFFELVVVPTFIMVIGWGYSLNRVQSSLYMFLYTFFSSLPLLMVLLYFSVCGISFSFFFSFFNIFNGGVFSLMSVFLFLVFLVKLPVFIVHLWLPKAHVDAPLLGSMILAGVLLKLGGYGLYKSMVYFFSDSFFLSIWFSSFSVWGGFLLAFLCLRQVDLKNLIAYSSVVHMGPVFSCVYLMSFAGLLGSYWMMFSHGLCSSCLFFLLNLFYFNSNSRSFLLTKGAVFFTPVLSYIWFIFCIANMGFPPSFNFFSELFIMVGSFFFSNLFMVFFLFLLIMSGFYSVVLYMSMNHGLKKGLFFEFFFSIQDFLVVYLSFIFIMFFLFFLFVFVC